MLASLAESAPVDMFVVIIEDDGVDLQRILARSSSLCWLAIGE